MVWTKEQEREYNKKYKKNNREKQREYNKKYREKNKEKIKAEHKKYHKENHMKWTIYNWKKRGLIVDDDDEYESIYYLVQSAENCELCNCKLTENKIQTTTSRCMDHDHFTGKFRNVLCLSCNLKQPRQKVIKL